MDKLELVTDKDIATFQDDGALCLRRVINEKWLELLRKGITYNRFHPSEIAKRKGHAPSFFFDYGNWRSIPEYREFIFGSPISKIARQILQSSKVALYSNHTIVKDSGSTKETPWHQDQAYYEIDGEQVCSIWLPVDTVSKETCLRVVKGSHKWPRYLQPVYFDGPPCTTYDVKPGKEEDAQQFLSVSDVDLDIDEKYEVLCWDMKPGDCIVFHMKTVHAAHGNNLPTPRRAFSTRWLGDDAVKGERPWMNLPPSPEMRGLETGTNLVDSGAFPVVWSHS